MNFTGPKWSTTDPVAVFKTNPDTFLKLCSRSQLLTLADALEWPKDDTAKWTYYRLTKELALEQHSVQLAAVITKMTAAAPLPPTGTTHRDRLVCTLTNVIPQLSDTDLETLTAVGLKLTKTSTNTLV